MEWKSYTKDRLISQHPSGFFVIKPIQEEPNDRQPIFCPLCSHIMNSDFDSEVYSKFKCCDSCANNWVYSNKEKWLQGWRPSQEEVLNKLQR